MTKLYDLAENYRAIADLLDDPTMEQAIIAQALATIEQDLTVKAGNMAALMKCIEGDISVMKAEEQRLADRRRATENRLKWLKDYIKEGMELAGLDKIKTATFTIALQNNPPRVEIDDMAKIPKQYIIETISYSPDKKAMADALKAGDKVEGAHLEQGRSLRIR